MAREGGDMPVFHDQEQVAVENIEVADVGGAVAGQVNRKLLRHVPCRFKSGGACGCGQSDRCYRKPVDKLCSHGVRKGAEADVPLEDEQHASEAGQFASAKAV